MEDGDDHDRPFVNEEVHSVREPLEKAATYRTPDDRELKRKFRDSVNQIEQLAGEPLTQTQTLVFVPERSFFDIGLSFRPEEVARRHARRGRWAFSFSLMAA